MPDKTNAIVAPTPRNHGIENKPWGRYLNILIITHFKNEGTKR